MSDLAELQVRLGHRFQDVELLEMALTHPSLGAIPGSAVRDNQRLEFLGDAVLQLVLTDELYRRFDSASEGPLTTARAHLVNRRTLSERARALSLGDYLRVSRGEEASGGRQRASALADALEAILGAIYLDGGLEAARAVVVGQFSNVFGGLEAMPSLDNPKGELQEWLQAESNESPDYRVESVTGPDHDRRFECTVIHRGVELGRGRGRSKKEAEGQAALMALRPFRERELARKNRAGEPDPGEVAAGGGESSAMPGGGRRA
jgi:ribonuclease-3